MSDPNDPQRRAIVTAFNSVARSSALHGQVEIQRVAIAVDQLVGMMRPGTPLNLGPIFELLETLNAPEEASHECLLAFEQRAATLGISLVLPAKTNGLSAEQKQRFLEAYHKRATLTPPAVVTNPRFDPNAKGVQVSGGMKAAPAAPPPAGPSAGGLRTKLLIALGVVALLAIVFVVFLEGTDSDPLIDVEGQVPGGLVCRSLRTAEGVAICRMDQSLFDAESEESLRQKALATKRALVPHGITALQIQTHEDGRFKKRY